MKQFYSELYIRILEFETTDVITTSGDKDPNVLEADNDVFLGGWEQ